MQVIHHIPCHVKLCEAHNKLLWQQIWQSAREYNHLCSFQGLFLGTVKIIQSQKGQVKALSEDYLCVVPTPKFTLKESIFKISKVHAWKALNTMYVPLSMDQHASLSPGLYPHDVKLGSQVILTSTLLLVDVRECMMHMPCSGRHIEGICLRSSSPCLAGLRLSYAT